MATIYTAEQIANYFLARARDSDLISNLKLQKLCYYAQGLGLSVRGEPMFKEQIEAWLHGPVVVDLYHKYKAYGADAIPPPPTFDAEVFHRADRMILDDVHTYYGQFSAWRLREMTHAEAPWKDHYDKSGGGEVIPLDDLATFFKDQVSDGYRRKYGEKSRA